MDHIEDALHGLTKIELSITGTDKIDGPTPFEFVEDTLDSVCAQCGAFYSYVMCPGILPTYEGEELFKSFERLKEGKENKNFLRHE